MTLDNLCLVGFNVHKTLHTSFLQAKKVFSPLLDDPPNIHNKVI